MNNKNMKLTNAPTARSTDSGMTLLELTVVIGMLLALVSILFVGGRAWKRGADRSASILQIRNVQQAVRAYSAMNSKNPGDTVPTLRTELFGVGRLMVEDPTAGAHPAGGGVAYVIPAPTIVPLVGTLYMTADDAEYAPTNIANW